MNEETKAKFMEEGTGDILGDIKKLGKTKKEIILDIMNRIDFEYLYEAGASYGTLSPQEAQHRYKLLLGTLPNIPDLTEEERNGLERMAKAKIRGIPEREIKRINDFLKDDEALEQIVNELAEGKGISYEDAKKQYLSYLQEKVKGYNKMLEEEENPKQVPGDGDNSSDGQR